MAMRKQAGLFVLVVALLLPLAASAAPAHHDSFDVTGTVFPCPTHTYTITSGTLKIVTHTTEAASGNTHFTATTTPNHVSLVDENGTVYSLSGAIWFAGDSEEELLTAIHMLNRWPRWGFRLVSTGRTLPIRRADHLRFRELRASVSGR
jgi:hypothetical protein